MTTKKVIGILLLTLFLSGCWDIEEPERMNYVYGMGIDYEDDQIVVYLQIPDMESIGSPEFDPTPDKSVVIAKKKGDNIASISNKIYQSAQRRLYFGHNTFVILSEEALRQGLLRETIDLLNRFPQTRYRINFFATQSNIGELLKVTTLFEETPILTRITDLQNTYEINSLVKNTSMRELIIQLNEPGYDGIIPAISLNTETWQDMKEGINMIETDGVALMHPNRYNGFIHVEEIKGLRWMQWSKRNDVLIFKDDQPIASVILVKPKHKIEIIEDEGKITFQIMVRSKGIITEVSEYVTYETIVKKLKRTISDEILQTYLAALALNSDIYRLSEQLYRNNYPIWKELQNNGSIPLDENSINIEVDIDLVDTSIDKLEPTIQ